MLVQTERIPVFLKPKRVRKDGKTHTYWMLVESVRTPKGPRHRTVAYLGELIAHAVEDERPLVVSARRDRGVGHVEMGEEVKGLCLAGHA